MGLGNNRDYKTRDRAARVALAIHDARMKELVGKGLSREEASKQAYMELSAGKLSNKRAAQKPKSVK